MRAYSIANAPKSAPDEHGHGIKNSKSPTFQEEKVKDGPSVVEAGGAVISGAWSAIKLEQHAYEQAKKAAEATSKLNGGYPARITQPDKLVAGARGGLYGAAAYVANEYLVKPFVEEVTQSYKKGGIPSVAETLWKKTIVTTPSDALNILEKRDRENRSSGGRESGGNSRSSDRMERMIR